MSRGCGAKLQFFRSLRFFMLSSTKSFSIFIITLAIILFPQGYADASGLSRGNSGSHFFSDVFSCEALQRNFDSLVEYYYCGTVEGESYGYPCISQNGNYDSACQLVYDEMQAYSIAAKKNHCRLEYNYVCY